MNHTCYINSNKIKTVKETMVPSVVHPVVVIWMIVKFLDLMEIPAGVVAAVVEDLVIHVVVVIVWAVVVEEDTTILVILTPVGEEVVVELLLDMIVVVVVVVVPMKVLPGDVEEVVVVVEWAEWDQVALLHPVVVTALV